MSFDAYLKPFDEAPDEAARHYYTVELSPYENLEIQIERQGDGALSPCLLPALPSGRSLWFPILRGWNGIELRATTVLVWG